MRRRLSFLLFVLCAALAAAPMPAAAQSMEPSLVIARVQAMPGNIGAAARIFAWMGIPPLFGGAQTRATPDVTDATAIIDGMQAYYDKAKNYSAAFDQKQLEINGIERVSNGVVWFKKPGKMRWDYQVGTDDERYLISDGTTFWSWEPAFQQYCSQDLGTSQLPTALTFLAGEGDIKQDFDFKLLESTNDKRYRVELTPKVPSSAYSVVEFELSKKTYRVEVVVIVDALGNVNTLNFKDAQINASDMADDYFVFEPPANAVKLCE